MVTMNRTTSLPSTTVNSTSCVAIGESDISHFLMSVYILAFIFGLIFNVLTLCPILQQVRRQNVLGIFLIGLSVSDLLFICTMPLWIDYYQQHHHWRLGLTLCKIAGFFYYSNMYISIFLLCCISVDRCFVVTYPLHSKTHRTTCYAWVQCAAVYTLAILMHVIVLSLDTLTDLHDHNERCYETFPMSSNVALFNLIRVGVGFVLPLLVLTFSYWKVLATVGQSPGLSIQAKRKVRLLSFGVIGIFSVCFAPYHVLLLVRSLVFYNSPNTDPTGSYCKFEQKVHFYFSCTLALSSLNCVVDPVLYVLVSNGVQKELRTFWKSQTKTQNESCVLTTPNRENCNNNLI